MILSRLSYWVGQSLRLHGYLGGAVQMGIQHGCSILGVALQQGLISHGEAIQAGLEYHPLFIKEQFRK